MKINNLDKIILIVLGITIIFFIFIIINLFMIDFFNKSPYALSFKTHGYTKENAVSVCSGRNLKRTCYCLNSFISGIFNYKPTSDSIYVDFETLKRDGGDCKNYQELYCELAGKIGYECTKVVVSVERVGNVLIKHTWAVVSNEEGYCNLDMDNIEYFRYG